MASLGSRTPAPPAPIPTEAVLWLLTGIGLRSIFNLGSSIWGLRLLLLDAGFQEVHQEGDVVRSSNKKMFPAGMMLDVLRAAGT